MKERPRPILIRFLSRKLLEFFANEDKVNPNKNVQAKNTAIVKKYIMPKEINGLFKYYQ
jgi:hypothetical protein